MFASNLLPRKQIYVTSRANNLHVFKDISMKTNGWRLVGKRYCYTLYDDNIRAESVAFFNSQKEFSDVIDTHNVKLLYPEVSKGCVKIYADSIPDIEIVCSCVICDNISLDTITDNMGASEVPYDDSSSNIGVSTVQEAIDYILSRLN